MKRTLFTSSVLLILSILSITGCKQVPTCTDGFSLTFNQGLEPNQRSTSDPNKCTYSQVVWYILQSDSTYGHSDDLLPITIMVDKDTIGIITTSAVIPGSICDNSILPSNSYVVYQLKNGMKHGWGGKTSNPNVTFNDSVRASRDNSCIPISLNKTQ